MGWSSKNGQEKKLTMILMQEEEKSEGCVPTKARKRKERQARRPRPCLLSHPRTKVGLLTGPCRERGADVREGSKGLDFLLDSAEKEGKLIKCSYISKYCGTGGNWKRDQRAGLRGPRFSFRAPALGCQRHLGPALAGRGLPQPGAHLTHSTPMTTKGARFP